MLLRRNAPIEGRPLEPVDLPAPEPGEGEVRLRVHACAVCRTDLHVIEADLPPRRLPLIPGHQVVGTVDALGPRTTRFKTGERVGVAWLRHTCGRCGFCKAGSENLCRESRYTGYHADGGYAEHCVVHEDYAYALPPALDDLAVAPLLCAGIVGYRALERCELPAGGKLALFGFGSSAHVILQVALARGAAVWVATRGAGHRDLARRLGAHWVGETFDTLPEAVDSAIVFAPAGEVVPAALRAVRPGGTVALAGIHMTPIPAMEYEPHLFHEKNLRSVEAATRADGVGLLREAAAAGVRAEVTPYALLRANEALIDLARDRVNGTAVLTLAQA